MIVGLTMGIAFSIFLTICLVCHRKRKRRRRHHPHFPHHHPPPPFEPRQKSPRDIPPIFMSVESVWHPEEYDNYAPSAPDFVPWPCDVSRTTHYSEDRFFKDESAMVFIKQWLSERKSLISRRSTTLCVCARDYIVCYSDGFFTAPLKSAMKRFLGY